MKWTLSKSRILNFLQCSKRLYLEVHHRNLIKYSSHSEAAFRIGDEVGETARKVLMPGGSSLKKTKLKNVFRKGCL